MKTSPRLSKTTVLSFEYLVPHRIECCMAKTLSLLKQLLQYIQPKFLESILLSSGFQYFFKEHTWLPLASIGVVFSGL